MTLIATDKKSIVVGLGVTGLSCVRYLLSQGEHVVVVDSRQHPPALEACSKEFPQVAVHCGEFDAALLSQATRLIVSPGVSLDDPAIAKARQSGVKVTGDVDLFSQAAAAPIIGITGSNGKSTVTTLLAEMANNAGVKVAVGGNLGVPVLDLLDASIELYVIELSSFQLETTQRLGAWASTVLNLSEDHMDRYSNKLNYLQAKQRVFRGSRYVIVNDDDSLSSPLMVEGMEPIHFGIGKPNIRKFSTMDDHGETFISLGFEKLMNVSEIRIKGVHNISNALAALSLGTAAGIDLNSMLETLKVYKGLTHRCQWVRNVADVDYINDSKGTNVGATTTAIESIGLSIGGKVVLIAGGDGKGADFSTLAAPMSRYGRCAILFGKDASLIADALNGDVEIRNAADIAEAVMFANELAKPSDSVLLSPACASFDMFRNFEERGNTFIEEVSKL